jgi:hypothetical protein
VPAYFLVDIREIKDAEKMDEFRSRVAPIVEKFGGRYLVRGGPFEVVEGSYQPVRLAMRWQSSIRIALLGVFGMTFIVQTHRCRLVRDPTRRRRSSSNPGLVFLWAS